VAEGGPFVEIVEGGPFAEIVEGGGVAEIVEGGGFAEIVEGGFAEIVEGGPFVEIIEGGPFAEIVEGGPFAEIVEGMGDIELNFEDARAMGKGRPYKVKGCVFEFDDFFSPLDPAPEPPITCSSGEATTHNNLVTFQQLQVGGIAAYQVQRKAKDAADPGTPDYEFANLPPLPSHLVTFTDHGALANGVVYVYRVKGLADDGGEDGAWSKLIEITAVNEPPVANPDPAAGQPPLDVVSGSSLVINVAANDTDPEGLASIYAKEITQAPAHGTATVNADGKVTYTANAGYVGPDSFQYKADNGPWSGDNDDTGVTNEPPFERSRSQNQRHASAALWLRERAEPAAGWRQDVEDRFEHSPPLAVDEE
jgi:Bacterial Ig domain